MEVESRIEHIVAEYGHVLRATIARLCPRTLGVQCEDIEQEALLRLWRALEEHREIRDLGAYIYRIAVSTTIDAVRRVKARREQQLEEQGSREQGGESRPAREYPAPPLAAPDRQAEGNQILERIEQAIDRLSAERRRAVGLHLQGLSNREVGEVLGWSEPKARNLIYRGLKDLRRQLESDGVRWPLGSA